MCSRLHYAWVKATLWLPTRDDTFALQQVAGSQEIEGFIQGLGGCQDTDASGGCTVQRVDYRGGVTRVSWYHEQCAGESTSAGGSGDNFTGKL